MDTGANLSHPELAERMQRGMGGVGQMARDALATLPIARDFRELVASAKMLTAVPEGGDVSPLIALATAFVGEGPLPADSGPLIGIECVFINEWHIPQPRVLIVSPRACYRVAFTNGVPCRFKRVPHEKVRSRLLDRKSVV